MVGLEHGPVFPGQGAGQWLTRSCDEKQRGLRVDHAVLQAQVRMEEEGEAFQLCTQQTVFIGLMKREKETETEKSHRFIIRWSDEDRNVVGIILKFLPSCVK